MKTIAIICVVALILAFIVFMVLRMSRGSKGTAKAAEAATPEYKVAAADRTEEEVAAIALALSMYQSDLHINEAMVITINRVGRVYSPWSSKIHGMRQMPNRK